MMIIINIVLEARTDRASYTIPSQANYYSPRVD